MKARERVAVGWIDPGEVDGAFAMSMLELYATRRDRIAMMIRGEGSGLLSRLRNELVQNFMGGPGEWLLFIDSDEKLSVAAFDKLIAAAHETERPIVAGLVFGAWPADGSMPKPVPTIARFDGGRLEPVWDYPRDKVIEVDSAGTGCLLVHRKVFEAMRQTADEHEGRDWCWFRDAPIGGRWVSEDVWFIRKAASLGFPIHAHTGVLLPHHKAYWLTEDVYRKSRIERAVIDPQTIERR